MQSTVIVVALLFSLSFLSIVQAQCTAHFTVTPEDFEDGVAFASDSVAQTLPQHADNTGWTVARDDSVVVNSANSPHYSINDTSLFVIADNADPAASSGRAATSVSESAGDIVDSWLISPPISLSQTCRECTVYWKAFALGSASYQVFAARSVDNRTELAEETPIFQTAAETSTWTNRTADLTFPSTGSIYIAWRHISNGTDAILLQIDEVFVSCGNCLDNAVWNVSSSECTCQDSAAYSDVTGCSCSFDATYYPLTGCWCDSGRVFNPSTGCECSGGATFSGGECTCTGGDTYVQGQGCVCRSGGGSGTCGCTGDATYSDTLGCVCSGVARYYPLTGCSCGSGEYSQSGCQCAGEGVFDENAFGCVCAGERSYSSGQGCNCLTNAAYQSDDGSCQCSGDGIYLKDTGCTCSEYGANYDPQLGCIGIESSGASALSWFGM